MSFSARNGIAIFVIAPIAAAALIAILLLIGVSPHLVFLPGHELIAALKSLGLHAHNRVGVLFTVFCWWAVIVAIGWAVSKLPPGSR